jgi:hypothetical protein
VSEAHLATVRALVRAFEEDGMEVAMRAFHPDVVMHAPERWPEPGPLVGRDEVLAQFVRLGSDWESHTMSIEDAESGPNWVVVRLLWRTKGAASAIALDRELSGVYFFGDDGLVHELAFCWDHDEARAIAERGPTG